MPLLAHFHLLALLCIVTGVECAGVQVYAGLYITFTDIIGLVDCVPCVCWYISTSVVEVAGWTTCLKKGFSFADNVELLPFTT